MTNKYYIANIDVEVGEFEFTDTYLFQTDGDPQEYHYETTRHWYEEEGAKPNEFDKFENDMVWYSTGKFTEISETTFNEMKKHLVEL